MATVNYTENPVDQGTRATVILWETLTSTNVDGQAFESTSPFYVDKTIQVLGTFSGATITLQGTNVASPTGTDWSTLHAPDGELLTITTAGIEAVLENVVAIRPLLSGGDGSTDLDVYLLCASSARR